MGSHRHHPPPWQEGSLAQLSTPPWRQGVFSIPLGIRPLLRLVALEVRHGDPGRGHRWGQGGRGGWDGGKDRERDGDRGAGGKDVD